VSNTPFQGEAIPWLNWVAEESNHLIMERVFISPFVLAKGRSAGWRSKVKSVLPGDKPTIRIKNETSRLFNQIASIKNSL
jgi:hypothetical protein